MINIAKLLKNCSQGTKLYSPLFGEVEFAEVMDTDYVPIRVMKRGYGIRFDKYGRYMGNEYPDGECLLFPSKDCRTWEGWKLPVEPKFQMKDWLVYKNGGTFCGDLKTVQVQTVERDWYIFTHGTKSTQRFIDSECRLWTIQDAENGDVLVNDAGCIFINAGFENDDKVTLACYCYVSVQGIFYEEKHKIGSWLYVSHVHPATKEQRDLLFAKMKEAGYQWDADKKKLYKIQPHYDIANFKPFDKVLVRDRNDEPWRVAFYGYYNKEANHPYFIGTRWSRQCIPFEGNEYLLGTTNMCQEEYINW